MPVPDLSNLRALIADDRAEVRTLLSAKLQELGLTRIHTVSTAAIGPNLLGIATEDAMASAPEPTSPDRLAELVARFTHDVSSPLTTALLSSRILASGRSDRPEEDAQQLRACVEEIAGLARALAQRVAAVSPRHTRSS